MVVYDHMPDQGAQSRLREEGRLGERQGNLALVPAIAEKWVRGEREKSCHPVCAFFFPAAV